MDAPSLAAAPPTAPITPPDDGLTPAMRQYAEQKRQVPDAILLFRMGDFYEMFYDDAETAARVLGIALTSRDGGRTPLAGIPHHALDNYLARLIAAGFRVAISEQIEDPRRAKGVVGRAIVRVVTPGTLTDEALLDQRRANVLAAVCDEGAAVGLAAAELASGELIVQTLAGPPERALLDELCRLAPSEVLLAEPDGVGRHRLEPIIREAAAAAGAQVALTYRSAGDFAARRAWDTLLAQYQVASLEGFGFQGVADLAQSDPSGDLDPGLRSAGAVLLYLGETQRTALAHMRPPRRRSISAHVELDASTLRSLEVERALRGGGREGTLLAAVDLTRNPMGARLLRQWLCYPLRDPAQIRLRQAAVAALLECGAGGAPAPRRRRGTRPGARADEVGGDGGSQPGGAPPPSAPASASASPREALRGLLREIGDIERRAARIAVKRTTPRELRGLGEALARLAPLRALLRGIGAAPLEAIAQRLDGLDELAERLCGQLHPQAPPGLREGGIFNDGVDPELDRLRAIARDGRAWLAEYQAREAQRTGIPTLKVGFNKVFGYYLEVTHPHRQRVPPDYVRRQTVKNAERYVTDELKRFEDESRSAESRAADLEYERFVALRDAAAEHLPRLSTASAALAELDVLAAWAELAERRGYVRPEFVEQPVLEIEDGRHPVVEQTHAAHFIPNDARLEAGGRSFALITGPNMAGKSTYIRQVALLVLLAHCGCFVPARRMRLGPVDRIFTRVGAADDLARGQSTFMVEMLEAANILHNATPQSLVILDEVGRGTSTFDGIALAWAITERLATRVGCRTLFATHYHELTELAGLIDAVFNLNVAVREHEERIVFLHRIVDGPADRSYGLHVAKLAGLPPEVLERAHAVLVELERTFARESQRPALAAAQRRRVRQLRLFEEPEERVLRELRELPADALDAARIVELVRGWRGLLGRADPR